MVNFTNFLWAHLHKYSCAKKSSNLKCKYKKALRKTFVRKRRASNVGEIDAWRARTLPIGHCHTTKYTFFNGDILGHVWTSVFWKKNVFFLIRFSQKKYFLLYTALKTYFCYLSLSFYLSLSLWERESKKAQIRWT